MRLKLLLTVLFWMFASSSFAATYYIAATGSDTNSGTSKSTPLLHAPGMTGCSNICAGITPAAGDQYIFRGGDTWYTMGAGTPIGLPWGWGLSVGWSGTSGSQIYVGVDQTWYSGSSWVRPQLNGGNPTSTSPVSSCTYTVGNTNVLLTLGGFVSYVTFDNFELLGLCWQNSTFAGQYINWQADNAGKGNILSNLYIHGWTHTSFSGGAGYTWAIVGTTYNSGGMGDQIVNLDIDGTDTDHEIGGIYGDCYDVHGSTFRYLTNGLVCNNGKTFHNNLLEYIASSVFLVFTQTHWNIIPNTLQRREQQSTIIFLDTLLHRSQYGFVQMGQTTIITM